MRDTYRERDQEIARLRHEIAALESELAEERANDPNAAMEKRYNETLRQKHTLERRLEQQESWARSRVRALLKPLILSSIATALVAALATVVFDTMRYVTIAPPLRAGYVTDRYYHHAWVEVVEDCHTVGKTRICTPRTVHHPERWEVRVAHDGQERVRQMRFQQWEQTRPGQWLCVESPCPPEPPLVEEFAR